MDNDDEDNDEDDDSSSDVGDIPSTAAPSATYDAPSYRDVQPTTSAAPSHSAESLTTLSADVSSDDEEVQHACKKAEEVYDFLTLPHKVRHCKCQLNNGRKCIDQFTTEEQDAIKMNMSEMLPYEKDLLLLGIISCSINATETTLSKKQKNCNPKKTRVHHFYYNHQRICRNTFMYLMEISKEKLHNLKQWCLDHGLVPQKKMSGGRQ